MRLGLSMEPYHVQVSDQGTSKAGPLPPEKEVLLQDFDLKYFLKKGLEVAQINESIKILSRLYSCS